VLEGVWITEYLRVVLAVMAACEEVNCLSTDIMLTYVIDTVETAMDRLADERPTCRVCWWTLCGPSPALMVRYVLT